MTISGGDNQIMMFILGFPSLRFPDYNLLRPMPFQPIREYPESGVFWWHPPTFIIFVDLYFT